MTLFKIIVNIAFAVLLAGKTIKSAAAEVVTSVANAVPSGTSSDFPGAPQLQIKGFAPHEFSIAGLLSILSEESVARTHIVSTPTMSTTAAPSGNTSVSVSPFATAKSSITSNATQAQTKAVLALDTSIVGLVSTLSEESVAGADHTSDTVSASITTTSHTSVSVTPWMTVSFTITVPSNPNNGSTSSAVDGNSTTSAAASVPSSDTDFTVTFTHISPTGTGQAHSISIITQPTQLTLTTTAAPSSSTENGGSKGAKPVCSGLVAVVVSCLGGFLFSL